MGNVPCFEEIRFYLNAMVIVGNANCIDFAKIVEAEINRANEAIAKRGKKTDEPAAE